MDCRNPEAHSGGSGGWPVASAYACMTCEVYPTATPRCLFTMPHGAANRHRVVPDRLCGTAPARFTGSRKRCRYYWEIEKFVTLLALAGVISVQSTDCFSG